MMTTEAENPADPDDIAFEAEMAAEAEQKRRLATFGLVGAFLAVLVLIVTVQWATDGGDSADGVALPDLTFTTLDGEPFALTELEGQPAVVNFFASWCAPCRAEMPDFEEVHQAVGDDVTFVGVNSRETDVDDARGVVDDTGVTYLILLGDDGGPGSLYQTVTDLGVMPTTAFIDADGIVVDVHAGILTADDLQDRVTELFG